MKQLFLFVLTTFFVQTSFCQNLSDTINVEYSKNSPKRFSMSISPLPSGLALNSLPNLNQFLKAQRIPNSNLDNISTYFPFGITYQANRFKILYELNFGTTTTSDRENNYSTTFDMKNGSISTGYAFFADRNNFVYFNLGIGYGEHKKTINKFNPQSTSLASALQNGVGQSIILRNTQGFIDVGLEFFNRTQGKRIGQCIRLGYRYGLKETPWSSQFINLSDAPSDRISSIYLEGFINIPYLSKKERANSTNN